MSGYLIGPSGVAPATSAWTPASFGANLVAWFKDPDVNTNTSVSGTNVTQWNDSGPNGYTIVPNAAVPPVYQATGLNGKPAVVFTAANADRLVTTSGAVNWGTGTDGSAFMLGSFTANSQALGVCFTDNSSNKFGFVLAQGTATTGILPQYAAGTGTVQPASINTVLRMGCVFDGAHATTYVNNVANSSPFVVTNAFTNAGNLGFNVSASTSCYDGPVREFFFVNRALTGTDLTNIDNYLASRA